MSCTYSEHDTLPVAEIHVHGHVTEHDMDEILPKMEAFIGRHGTVRIIEVIETFEGMDPTTILDGLKFDMQHMINVSHAAVVTDLPWIGFLTRAAAMVMPVTTRVFTMDQVDEARAWIEDPS